MPARTAHALPPSTVPLPSTAHLPPTSTSAVSPASAAAATTTSAAAQQDALSVILVTGGYDNTIRFWEAWSGVCSRTLNYQEHVSSLSLVLQFTDRYPPIVSIAMLGISVEQNTPSQSKKGRFESKVGRQQNEGGELALIKDDQLE
jgi:hypothetical protein